MVKSKPSATAKRSGTAMFGSFVSRHVNPDGRFGMSDSQSADLEAEGLNGKTALQLFVDEEGLYGSATVLDDADFDRYVEENGLEVMYRGMPDSGKLSGAEKHENFMYDQKYYIGQGYYADGMYFSDNELTGQRYACDSDYTVGGAVIRAALKPGAKVIDTWDASGDYFAHSLSGMVGFESTESMKSALALANGYDAIVVRQGGETQIVVLNRNAVVVSSNIRKTNRYGMYL